MANKNILIKNPTINEVKLPVPPRRYPITVTCVLRDIEEAKDDTIKKIKKHALDNNIMFETRIYDSYKYLKDRDEITSLPAFHIYIHSFHQVTFYPGTRPIQIINDTIKKYLSDVDKKKKRKQKWSEWVNKVLMRIRLLGRKPTRLEQAEIEKPASPRRESFIERYRTSFVDMD